MSRTTPLDGLRACTGSHGNVGPEVKAAVPCAVCGAPIADPPPQPRRPGSHPLVETCSFRCALSIFEARLQAPLPG